MSEERHLFRSRGVGNNWYPCFICGHKPLNGCQHDLAGFVDAKQVNELAISVHSHPILSMAFHAGVLANLDYRASEPHRVQVKFGACGEHLPNLELLGEMVARTECVSNSMLLKCIPGRKRP